MDKHYMSTKATLLTIQMNIINNQQNKRAEILFVLFYVFRQSWTKVLRHFRFQSKFEIFSSMHLEIKNSDSPPPPLVPSAKVEFRESQVHIGVYRGGPMLSLGKVKFT